MTVFPALTLGALLSCALSTDALGQKYTISTAAGTGSLNQDGPATAATLSNPPGVAVDSSGNLYISDYNAARVFKVTSDGVIGAVAGSGVGGYAGDGGPALAARISGPFGMAADKSGAVYFADSLNNRVRRLNADGTIDLVAGAGPATFSGLSLGRRRGWKRQRVRGRYLQ